MLRQFEDLPPHGDAGPDYDVALAHGSETIERLWRAVEARLSKG